MGTKLRQQQHREEAEEKKRSRQLVELRQENQQLKKKVSRLQKALDKMSRIIDEPDDDGDESNLGKATNPSCLECKSQNLVRMILPSGAEMVVCKECGWRKTNGRNNSDK